MWKGIGSVRVWAVAGWRGGLLGVVGVLSGCSDYAVLPSGSVDGLQMQVLANPAALTVADVPVGDVRSASVALENHGARAVSLVDLHIAGSSAFWMDLPSQSLVSPGESVSVEVFYSPDAMADRAVLEVAHRTDDAREGMLAVPLEGTGLAGVLEVVPGVLDLGGYPDGCVVQSPMTIENVGTDDVAVRQVSVVGEGFSVADDGANPWLAPGETVEVMVEYRASEWSGTEGQLWVEHDGVGGTLRADIVAETLPRLYTEETFRQDGPWDAVDIVFAVDGSGSMDDDTSRLADNARAFFRALHSLDLDARVVGVTRDDGCVNGRPVSTRDDGAEEAFARSLDGTWGVHTESLLTVSTHALEAADGCNVGVFRSEARTAVVFLSDEPDQSDDPWESYVERMRAVDPHVVLSAIVGPAPEGCDSAYPGHGYLEAAEATGGASVSLCAQDWSSFLELQAEVVAGSPRARFELSEPPGPGEAFVWVNGDLATDWWLDLEAGELVFDDDAIPGPGALIEVEYPVGTDCDPTP
jgi:hypothetical protein